MGLIPFRKKTLTICVKNANNHVLLPAKKQAKIDYDNLVNSFIRRWTIYLKKL